jgi:predicted glycogen debranching enzyme
MKQPTLSLTKEQLKNFELANQTEWLITNGIGGYASQTVLGVNTRKYHGLLIAALQPPGERVVFLSKLEEEIATPTQNYQLSTNEFQDVTHPQGYRFQEAFSISPFPTYLYKTPEFEMEKTIFMLFNQNLTATIYRFKNQTSNSIKAKITPLITCRHIHSVINKISNQLRFSQQQNLSQVQISFELPKSTLSIKATLGSFQEKPNWIERIYYRQEAMRGESSIDDCYQPGAFQIEIEPNSELKFSVAATVNQELEQNNHALAILGNTIVEIEVAYQTAQKQQSDLTKTFYSAHPTAPKSSWLSWILLAADNFIVKSLNNHTSIIAGYPWFETWGRDTFISLPGLLLTTGRFKEAQNVLSTFNAYCRRGLIPNFIEDKTGKAVYNAADATLWYINSVLQYIKYTRDFDFIQNTLWSNLKTIVESHITGTDFGIKIDNDGLLQHGEQLTWMDAQTNNKPVTPRAGKAVEIQALWYNTLKTMQLLARKFNENNLADTYEQLAAKTKTSFNQKFWNSQRNCLFDVLETQAADDSLRPNQIIALSLEFNMLDALKSDQIIHLLITELITPYGLRTLEPKNPNYHGNYSGNRQTRDQAYHNGTIWPWLNGPLTTAYIKTKGYNRQNIQFALKNFILPILEIQIQRAGLGNISEILDGDPPHTPRGCIAQAWSVAEPLRAYIEDVLQIRAPFEIEILQN